MAGTRDRHARTVKGGGAGGGNSQSKQTVTGRGGRGGSPLDALAHPGIPTPHGVRDRRVTEAELEAAALRLIARDGILAGLNLREVASEAGINRALVYQYFGSRRALIRSALTTLRTSRGGLLESIRALPFLPRRQHLFRSSRSQPVFARVEAILALDGDEELRLFPSLPRALEELERDKREGELAHDLDAKAVHAMTMAAHLGYLVFRENIAREMAMTPEELDEGADVVFTRMLEGLRPPTSPAA